MRENKAKRNDLLFASGYKHGGTQAPSKPAMSVFGASILLFNSLLIYVVDLLREPYGCTIQDKDVSHS